MTKRDRKLEQAASEAHDEEGTLWIGQVLSQTGGEFQVSVNARPLARDAVASNEFAFASQGRGSSSIVGEHVVIYACEKDDLCVLMGSSPYVI